MKHCPHHCWQYTGTLWDVKVKWHKTVLQQHQIMYRVLKSWTKNLLEFSKGNGMCWMQTSWYQPYAWNKIRVAQEPVVENLNQKTVWQTEIPDRNVGACEITWLGGTVNGAPADGYISLWMHTHEPVLPTTTAFLIIDLTISLASAWLQSPRLGNEKSRQNIKMASWMGNTHIHSPFQAHPQCMFLHSVMLEEATSWNRQVKIWMPVNIHYECEECVLLLSSFYRKLDCWGPDCYFPTCL